MIHVKEIMGQPIMRCRIDETLDAAARLMWEHDCGILPVVDETDRLVGVITDRDVCMAAYTQGKPLFDLRVEGAMARKVYSCHEEDDVETAEQVMATARVRRLPVIDGGHRPVGMLSLCDIARVARGDGVEKASGDVFCETLAAICAPTRRAISPA